MPTLTEQKADLIRTFEDLGRPDAHKITRALSSVGAWPKAPRTLPEPDHIAALTLAALLPDPPSQFADAFTSISSLALEDDAIQAFGMDTRGGLTTVDARLLRRDDIVFLVERNMASPVSAIRYLLSEVISKRITDLSRIPVFRMASAPGLISFSAFVNALQLSLMVSYGDRLPERPGIWTERGFAADAVKAIADAAAPFFERSSFETWDQSDMPALSHRYIEPLRPTIQ